METYFNSQDIEYWALWDKGLHALLTEQILIVNS